MNESNNKSQERVYLRNEACVFRKTKEQFGGLSNMASGYPILVNGIHFYSSEALYQACRYPFSPDIQAKIIAEKSPMSAKMVGKPHVGDTRNDWDFVRKEIMAWCLRVKLAQNFISFGSILESTYNLPIVEESHKDAFWGAIKEKDNQNILRGVNALGRLLMQLRQQYNSENRYLLLHVPPPNIPDFHLFNNPIQIVDERLRFQDYLRNKWGLPVNENKNIYLNLSILEVRRIEIGILAELSVASSSKKKKKQKKPTSKQTKKVKDILDPPQITQPELPM